MVENPLINRLPHILGWLEQLQCDDRLMIIIASSRLDDMLKQLLKTVMVHQAGSNDALFESNGPLGSFSSRILFSYRLGLIDRDYESFLQTIRKLRNDAAHAAEHMDLSSAPHIDRIVYLQNLAATAPTWSIFVRTPLDPKKSPGASLFASLTVSVLTAEIALANAKPFDIKNPCGFHFMKVEESDSPSS